MTSAAPCKAIEYRISTRSPSRLQSRKAQPLRSDEKPEEADGDICLSLNPASRTLVARSDNTGPAEQNRSCYHGYLFLSLLTPRAQENCAIIQDFGWEEREREMDAESRGNSTPNAYIIPICTHLCFFSYFSPILLSICQQSCASLSLSRDLPLSLAHVNKFSDNSSDDASFLSLSAGGFVTSYLFCVRKKDQCGIISSRQQRYAALMASSRMNTWWNKSSAAERSSIECYSELFLTKQMSQYVLDCTSVCALCTACFFFFLV